MYVPYAEARATRNAAETMLHPHRAGQKAEDKGYSQVLWLDGVERKYIEEVGAMNVMFRIGDEIVTPALTGSILSGITRKSCIEISKTRDTVCLSASYLWKTGKRLKNGTLKEAGDAVPLPWSLPSENLHTKMKYLR